MGTVTALDSIVHPDAYTWLEANMTTSMKEVWSQLLKKMHYQQRFEPRLWFYSKTER